MLRPLLICLLLASNLGHISLAQTSESTNKIIEIDSIVATIKADTGMVKQHLVSNHPQFELIKTINKFDSSQTLIYTYQLTIQDFITNESETYYSDSKAIYKKEIIINTTEQSKLDHDGMPIRSFPAKKSTTYFINNKVLFQDIKTIDYNSLGKNIIK